MMTFMGMNLKLEIKLLTLLHQVWQL
jgi:hypothetical protein